MSLSRRRVDARAAQDIHEHRALGVLGSGSPRQPHPARNAGVNLAFFTGNTMWWKTRWANSQYGNEPYRTLITYKESLDSAQSDPG